MDASAHKKLGRVFVCDMVKIPAKQRKSAPQSFSVTREKPTKMPPEFIRGEVVVQGVEGSNPFSHPIRAPRQIRIGNGDIHHARTSET